MAKDQSRNGNGEREGPAAGCGGEGAALCAGVGAAETPSAPSSHGQAEHTGGINPAGESPGLLWLGTP